MAASKQIPNQPSSLGTIQVVTVPCLVHFVNPCVPAQNLGTVFSILGKRHHAFPMTLAQLRCLDPPLPPLKPV